MSNFPLLLDTEEALEHYLLPGERSDAEKAYIVSIFSKDGHSNSKIRELLSIEKVYTITHLKRVGLSLTDTELALWHNNPHKITFGHVRAVAKLPETKRMKLLRELLSKKMSVRLFEQLAKEKPDERDFNTQRYEETVTKVLGRGVKIKYNPVKKTGSILLDFYRLEDLTDILAALGYAPKEDY